MLDHDDWRCTSGQLCALLGVPHKQLSRWAAAGMPKLARGEWDLRATVQWLLAHMSGADSPEDQGEALTVARKSLIVAQNRKLDIEIERLEGSIYDAAVVHSAFDALAVIVSSAHNALPGEAPDLVGLGVDDIETRLENATRDISEAIANAIGSFRLAKGEGLDAMEAGPAPT